MITEYGVYNNHELDNTLLILFSDSPIEERKELSEEMVVLYSSNKVVGYKIENFIKYAKIKYSGIIFLPNNLLIDVINSILSKYGLETLAYKTSSGYITKKDGNHLRVFALKGTFLRDMKVSKGQYCSYYDLYINEDLNLVELSDTSLEDIDFFQIKEN